MSLPEGKRLSGMKIAKAAAHKEFVQKEKARERAGRQAGARTINGRTYQLVDQDKNRRKAEQLADARRGTGRAMISVQRTKDGWGVYACTA